MSLPLLKINIIGGRLVPSTFNNSDAEVMMQPSISLQAIRVDPDAEMYNGITGTLRHRFNYALVNEPAYFQINDYHFTETLALATSNGTVALYDRDRSVLVYTPDTLGVGGFSIAGHPFPMTVVGAGPVPPTILSPISESGIPQVQLNDTIIASPYLDLSDQTSHDSTLWEFATDSNFSNVVGEISTGTPETELLLDEAAMTAAGLNFVTAYFVRVSYYGVPD